VKGFGGKDSSFQVTHNEISEMKAATERPWHIIIILLVALMPVTGNIFLYSFAMSSAGKEWGLTPFWAAVVGFVPLAAKPLGGILFGSLSDRYGRRKVLLLSILLSGISAALSGLSFGPLDFGLYRLLLGIVLGGQWAVTMTLVSEIWQAEERGKAVGVVQTSFPAGFVYASLIAVWASGEFSWRTLLMLGALPAAFAAPLAYFAIRESPLWIRDVSGTGNEGSSYRELFEGDLLKYTVLGTLIMFIGSFGAWLTNPWIPVYLGQLGMTAESIPLLTLLIMLGGLAGYTLYGFISDRLGRRQAFRLYFIGMAGALVLFGFLPSQSWFTDQMGSPAAWIVILGGSVAFCLGYFSGYGTLFAELFPTHLRSRGLGFCYSVGGIGASIAPAATGYLSSIFGLGHSFMLASLVFIIGFLLVQVFPETRGKRL